MALEKYHERRDFHKTPEPSGESTPGTQPGLLYVIQKHAARRLHYDFRLELDGVLVSWAVPKGPSLDPHDRHLAAKVEDHPVEYGTFEGTIPKGEYGGGTVELWDRGTWEPEGDPRAGLARGDLKFTLYGKKLRGSWVLVRMKPRAGKENGDNWLLIKHRDEFSVDGDGQRILTERPESVASGRVIEEIAAEAASSVWHGDQPPDQQSEAHPGEEFALDPSRLPGARAVKAMPSFVKPELATLVKEAPEGSGWLHEVKYDGYRALSRIDRGAVQMLSRNEKDWTTMYRSLVEELAALPLEGALLDGEVVVQMPDGTTSFQELQNALRSGPGERSEGRLVYYVFDLLYLNGYDLTRTPIEERKILLKRLVARHGEGRVLYSEHVVGDGREFAKRACDFGLEGVVSKKSGTLYRPGVRGTEWLKTKCWLEQEFVIGGFTDPGGGRIGFGALLLGVHENEQLRYVGKVGTGFNDRFLRELGRRLRDMEVQRPAFTSGIDRIPRGAHWVRPELMAEVAFSEWTRRGDIRHPSFRGLREDKPAGEIIMEKPRKVETGTDIIHGVGLTHADRVFWPADGTTKRDLVDHYEAVADWMLPYVLGRPVAMVRCPDGVAAIPGTVRQGRGQGGTCFFHKHPSTDFPGPFERVTIVESGGPETYLTITERGSLTALAQMGVLEIHIWGATWPDIEHPDMLVFDFDPDPAVEWSALVDGARLMKQILEALGLRSFVKTTGGKGLHVVAPIIPTNFWGEVRNFCKAVADALVAAAPDRYTANMSKAKRAGKTYVDYVRNTRGSTSIAPYSTRAREHSTVAVPLRWTELKGHIRPDTYTTRTIQHRLRSLRGDPWEGYFEVAEKQTITDAMKKAIGSA